MNQLAVVVVHRANHHDLEGAGDSASLQGLDHLAAVLLVPAEVSQHLGRQDGEGLSTGQGSEVGIVGEGLGARKQTACRPSQGVSRSCGSIQGRDQVTECRSSFV